jgi:4-hydroxybenzoate polyprenyltransferase
MNNKDRPIIFDNNKVLVIDCEKSLLSTNLFLEIFWHLVSLSPLNILKIFIISLHGLKKVKIFLLENVSIDYTLLPYKEDMLEVVKDWKKKGGKVVLISNINEEISQNISNYLSFFDSSYAYDNSDNINAKIKLICEEFNKKESIFYSKNNVSSNKKTLSYYIKQLRPKQWIKNLLVLSPLFLLQEFELTIFVNCLYSFFALCYFASCIYIINDLLDLNADRRSSIKKNRPLAAGKVSITLLTCLSPPLIILGLVGTYLILNDLFYIISIYLFLSLGYVFYLKKKVLIDVFVLAGLYTIRLLVGAEAALMQVSFWILAFCIFVFLSLASIKRYSDIKSFPDLETKKIWGRGYELVDLRTMEIISIVSSFSAAIVLALYINTTEVKNLILNIESLWAICLIFLYWILRLNLVARRSSFPGDPLEFAANDRVSYACLIAIVLFYINGSLNFISLYNNIYV